MLSDQLSGAQFSVELSLDPFGWACVVVGRSGLLEEGSIGGGVDLASSKFRKDVLSYF